MTNSFEHRITTRRDWLMRTGAATAGLTLPFPTRSVQANSRRRTGMGLVIYDCNIRRRSMRRQNPGFDLFEPLTFLKHCNSIGAGGMQASLGVLSGTTINRLSEYAHQHTLFIEAIVKSPADDSGLSRFEAEIKTASEVGVTAARTTVFPGRRYERLKTLNEFLEYQQRAQATLERAAPIVEKHRVPLAVENHKDQRIDERIALLKHLDSEFIGTCVDTGNSFALLDGAYESIEAFAPYAFSVHLKDQSLQEFDEGFLLGDIPLGQGSFDLPRMVKIIKKFKPDVKFSLELITRDALKVPCLSDQYFATMPSVPAKDLARAMRFVKEHPTEGQIVSTLPLDQQLQLEDANVATSIDYAEKVLGL